MKLKILQIVLAAVFLFFTGTGCQEDKIELADESIVVDNQPGLFIYKTSRDYFNYISFQLTSEGQPNAVPAYILNDPRIVVDEKGHVKPDFRWRLKSGYIVDSQTNLGDVFTDITIQEYVDYNSKNEVACWPDELLLPRIIDKNPFIELYHIAGLGKPYKSFTLGELNEMFENGTIEEYFTKLK